MPFSANEISNIANASLDYYLDKGDQWRQTLQKRPLMDKLVGKKKYFPGGKGNISVAVSGDFGLPPGTSSPPAGVNDVLRGYTHDDTVLFYTPANIKRANYPWREHHIGLELTHTELKIDGISVVDPGSNGERLSEHSRREMTVLVGLLEDKLFDLGEKYARDFNKLLYGNGVADSKALAGLALLVADDPSVGTVGGLDRGVAPYGWWRNIAYTNAFGTKVQGDPTLAAWGGDAIDVDVTDGGALLQALQSMRRKLTRYGGEPDLMVAGSDFLGGMELEMRANSIYSQTGVKKDQDGAMGTMYFAGTEVVYDPTLDDMGRSKFAYWLDTKKIMLMCMEDEWMHKHTPARPHDKFLMYRSITSTCQLIGKQFNSSAVIEIN
jgi:hypothetical protein